VCAPAAVEEEEALRDSGGETDCGGDGDGAERRVCEMPLLAGMQTTTDN
jgi:hypothetical protein